MIHETDPTVSPPPVHHRSLLFKLCRPIFALKNAAFRTFAIYLYVSRIQLYSINQPFEKRCKKKRRKKKGKAKKALQEIRPYKKNEKKKATENAKNKLLFVSAFLFAVFACFSKKKSGKKTTTRDNIFCFLLFFFVFSYCFPFAFAFCLPFLTFSNCICFACVG